MVRATVGSSVAYRRCLRAGMPSSRKLILAGIAYLALQTLAVDVINDGML